MRGRGTWCLAHSVRPEITLILMRSSLAPHRIRASRRLFAACSVNGLGDWFGEIALAELVLHHTEPDPAVHA